MCCQIGAAVELSGLCGADRQAGRPMIFPECVPQVPRDSVRGSARLPNYRTTELRSTGHVRRNANSGEFIGRRGQTDFEISAERQPQFKRKQVGLRNRRGFESIAGVLRRDLLAPGRAEVRRLNGPRGLLWVMNKRCRRSTRFHPPRPDREGSAVTLRLPAEKSARSASRCRRGPSKSRWLPLSARPAQRFAVWPPRSVQWRGSRRSHRQTARWPHE